MKDRNASSYNLQDAKTILAALVAKGPQRGQEEKSAGIPGYVRMSTKAMPRPQTAVTDSTAPPGETLVEEPLAPPKEAFLSWEECIAWCMQATRSEAAFVVDSQGFIIAVRGRVPAHGFECTGAELVYAMDQLQRIDPDAGKLLWIDLDYNKRRVVGLVTPSETEECFIVGMISPDVSYNTVKHTMVRQITASLGVMN